MYAKDIARDAGVSTDTLRYYERKGLLPRPPRLANGYRDYGPEAVERVRLIRGALAIGFSVEELATVLRARARGSPPCRRVREIAAARLEETEARLAEMVRFRDALRGTLRSWDALLSATPPGREAHLLESIGSPEKTSAGPSALAALRFQKTSRRRKR